MLETIKYIQVNTTEEHADLALCFEVLGWNDKTTRRQIMAEKANRWANWLTAVKQIVGS